MNCDNYCRVGSFFSFFNLSACTLVVCLTFGQASLASGNDAAAITEALNAEINAQVAAKNDFQQQAIQAANFTRLQSVSAIAPNKKAMTRLSQAAEKCIALLRAAPAKAFLAARAKGLSQDEANRTMQALHKSLETADARPIVLKMQADREWATLHIALYSHLEKSSSQWTPADSNSQISIAENSGAFKNALIDFIEKIKAVEDRADALMTKMGK